MRLIGVNEKGARVGQDHPRAVLTDAQVEMVLVLHQRDGWGYRRIARVLEVSRESVRDVCKGRRRCQVAVTWRVVCVL